jgi:hypothetical protein
MSSHRNCATSLLLPVLASCLLMQLAAPPAAAQLRIVEEQNPPAQLQMPDADGMMILIRTTLIALDHANRTGNYTVLRDIGSPGFREANDPARLAELFADLRKRGLVLAPISVVDATLTSRPALDANNMLRLTGFFETRPEEVNFDLLFEFVNGSWRLFGLGIGTSQAKEVATQTAPPREAPPPAAQPRNVNIPLATASPLVKEAQQLLEQLGYQPGRADGFPGPRTLNAVRAFQRAAGLEETGEITAEVVEAMRGRVD